MNDLTPYREGKLAARLGKPRDNPYHRGWGREQPFEAARNAARWASEWDAGYADGSTSPQTFVKSPDTAIEYLDAEACRGLSELWLDERTNDPRIAALRYTIRDAYERELIPGRAIITALETANA